VNIINLKADIMLAPHHGLTRTLDKVFLEKLNPRILICNCSSTDHENNRIIRYNDRKLLYTCESGAITIRVDPMGRINVASFRP